LTRSKLFWTGAILLAIIPMLLLDIPKHYIDWKDDVHDEQQFITQNTYQYSVQQKAVILHNMHTSNHALQILIYTKGIFCLLLFALGISVLLRYLKTEKKSGWTAVFPCFVLMAATTGLKLFSWTTFGGNSDMTILPDSPADTSLLKIYDQNFKGKVVYVDFWGTTCAPCLEEFRNFTKPLKDHYKNRPDLAYLYICGGMKLIWKQQLQKFNIEGSHIFLDKKDYAMLYHRSVRGAKDTILAMPRYLIIDKKGNIVDKDAPPPSQKDSIEARLDKYLAGK